MKRHYNIERKYIKELVEMFRNQGLDDELLLLITLEEKLKNNFCVCNEDYDSLYELKEQTLGLDKYKSSYQHVKLFCTKGMYMDGSKYISKFNRINISEKESINLSKEFFHECGPFFSEPFVYFDEDAKEHLKFIAPSKNTDGEMIYIPSIDEYFMFVPRYNNLSRVSILIHEVEHYLDIVNRYEFHKQYLIRESSAIFMEMIGCDWLADKLHLLKDGVKRRFEIHSLIKSEAYDLYFKNQLLHIIKKRIHLSDKELLAKLEDYGFNKHNLNFFAHDSLDRDYTYQISYLIAIELYNIYQFDKERALYILKYIVLNGTDENIFRILNSFKIHLNRSVHKIERDMCLSLIKKED